MIEKPINLLFISLSGNTKNFVERLKNQLEVWHDKNVTLHNVYELMKNKQDFYHIDSPIFVFVPTYLSGGNGIDNGDEEILTTDLRKFIASNNNAENVVGIIGSGNKNFNEQYCLTAKQYCKQFNKPVIYDFELRGMQTDIDNVTKLILDLI